MSFVQLEFPLFGAIVFALTWALGRRSWQNTFLLVASCVFYGWARPWFVALMLGSAVVDFALARAIERWWSARWRLVALSVVLNLALLGYFKYTDFFAENVVGVLRWAGWRDAAWSGLGVVLPVGISFYTFQSIGYIVDVARGEVRAVRDARDYLLYVAFFPQLVAGPINRAGALLPQVARERTLDGAAVRSGVSLALWGAFKKLVVADSVAPYVDKVFVLEHPAGPLIWAATFGFMIQIYADFSGYTDTARGVARTLGFELAQNFREPFLARTTVEFWQRWHVSLSTWLRDYLLGPLVGDAGAGRLRFAAATLATFVLVGLWHGPSWNFVLFGLYQGMWVLVYATLGRVLPAGVSRIPLGGVAAAAFHLVAVGLVGSLLFRERHLDRLWSHLTTPPLTATPEQWYAAGVLVTVVLAGCAPMLAEWAWSRYGRPRIEGHPLHLAVQTTGWALGTVLLFVFYRTTVQDFVYFQF